LRTVTGGHQVHAELALQNLAGTGNKFSIGKNRRRVDLDSPALPQKSLKMNLDGSVTVDLQAQDLAARLAAHFDETNASMRTDVHGFSTPRIGFDVELDRLNLDRYLPPAAPASGPKPASAPAVTPAVDPKVDLSALKPLNLAAKCGSAPCSCIT